MEAFEVLRVRDSAPGLTGCSSWVVLCAAMFFSRVAVAPAEAAEPVPAPPTPAVVFNLLLEDSVASPGESIHSVLWATNSSQVAIESIELSQLPSDSLYLAADALGCHTESEAREDVVLPGLSASDSQKWRLWICVDRQAKESDVEARFALTYRWASGAAHQVIEVPLKIRVLGVSLPGVPVGLASLLLPGVLLLYVLRMGGFAWVDKLGAVEQAAAGTALSILVAGSVNRVWSPAPLGSVSLLRLSAMCGVALLVAGIAVGVRAALSRLKREPMARPGDSDEEIIWKALKGRGPVTPAVSVTTSSSTWTGGFAVPREDGGVELLCWLSIEPKNEKQRKTLERYLRKNKLARAAKRIKRWKLQFKVRDAILEGGSETDLLRKSFGPKDFASWSRSKEAFGSRKPLSVKTS